MDGKNIKILFGDVAKSHGFIVAFGGWYIKSEECLVVLELQKSNYGNYYIFNVKLYINGFFSKHYEVNKQLIKNEPSHIPIKCPADSDEAFNLEVEMSLEARRNKITRLFVEFIDDVVGIFLTKEGVVSLYESNRVILFEPMKEFLNIKN